MSKVYYRVKVTSSANSNQGASYRLAVDLPGIPGLDTEIFVAGLYDYAKEKGVEQPDYELHPEESRDPAFNDFFLVVSLHFHHLKVIDGPQGGSERELPPGMTRPAYGDLYLELEVQEKDWGGSGIITNYPEIIGSYFLECGWELNNW